MKRIVEEKLLSGKTRYRVETNRIFGFIPCKWNTDTFYDAEHDMTFKAVFDSISDAYIHIGLNREGKDPDGVISRKIVY